MSEPPPWIGAIGLSSCSYSLWTQSKRVVELVEHLPGEFFLFCCRAAELNPMRMSA
jgi:hypothetical protein